MALDNRVLWSEGMFLQPQHFQQHDRWIESQLRAQGVLRGCFPWGLKRLVIDRELLDLGKFAVTECAGILPDGTVFDAPASDPLPEPLDVIEADGGQVLYLALPLARPNAVLSGPADSSETGLRYRAGEETVRDNTGAGGEALLNLGRLDLRLSRERDVRDGFACCGIARVQDCRADRKVTLDPGYVPPSLDIAAAPMLRDFVEELQGLLHRQGDARAARLRGARGDSVAHWADFALLQVINRAEPVVVHWSRSQGLHPELLYRALVALAGELATFASDAKRAPELPPYRHEDLQATFVPIIERLRDYLSRETAERAVAIPIEELKYGFRRALVQDRSLFAGARFVLAGKAQVPSQVLRNRFPTQVKIGPIDKIPELVKLALPGIELRPLQAPPQEIPQHGGLDYFELERSNELWQPLVASGGFGLHVGGDFPGLQLELWAIRS
ncbi:MAG: type VI secretion system baseplate subunit TssK [Gammaproteobacteria bacterium]|jgi:type VI secretion system protein ImpJ|nr:type VI secretion system baseplate subunit TssK [Gammaproteobacteria bacterium]